MTSDAPIHEAIARVAPIIGSTEQQLREAALKPAPLVPCPGMVVWVPRWQVIERLHRRD